MQGKERACYTGRHGECPLEGSVCANHSAGDMRAIQLLLGHTKLDSTVRYLGVRVEEALAIGAASAETVSPATSFTGLLLAPEQDPFRARARQLMPVALQNYLAKECRSDQETGWSRVDGEDVGDPVPRCLAPDMPALIDATAREFAENRELRELARGAVAQMDTTLSVLRNIGGDAEILIEKIEMRETP